MISFLIVLIFMLIMFFSLYFSRDAVSTRELQFLNKRHEEVNKIMKSPRIAGIKTRVLVIKEELLLKKVKYSKQEYKLVLEFIDLLLLNGRYWK